MNDDTILTDFTFKLLDKLVTEYQNGYGYREYRKQLNALVSKIYGSLSQERRDKLATAYAAYLRIRNELPPAHGYNLVGPAIRWKMHSEYRQRTADETETSRDELRSSDPSYI